MKDDDSNNKRKLLSPIIHLTNLCNLGCAYCYTGSSFEILNQLMLEKEEVRRFLPNLFSFINQVVDLNESKETVILFHGGEPLIIGIEIWREIFDFINRSNKKILVDVQTNGTLLDQEFIKLFKKQNVNIGISLDGPKCFNDITRHDKNNHSCFNRILQNIDFLKRENVDFGCLSTLNSSNLDVHKLYEFFKEKKIGFGIRPIFDNPNLTRKDLLISNKDYAKAFCLLFDEWFFSCNEEPRINDFNKLVAGFIEYESRLPFCTFSGDCTRTFITIDKYGDIYPCNCLMEPEFKYGNLNQKPLKDILDSPQIKKLSERWNILQKSDCKDCSFSSYCYGGCPSRAYGYYGDYFRKDPFCLSYQQIFKHVNQRVLEATHEILHRDI